MPLDKNGTQESNNSPKPTPSEDTQPNRHPAPEPSYEPENEKKRPRSTWAEITMVIFTGLILITYITLTILSWKQMRLTEKSLEQSRTDNTKAILAQQQIAERALNATVEHFRLEQRAWVTVLMAMDAIESGKPLGFTITAQNTGKTFAKAAIVTYRITFSRHEILTERELQPAKGSHKPPASVAILAPNLHYDVKDSFPAEYIPVIKQHLGEGGNTYIWGDVFYLDVFGKQHTTKYCGFRPLKSTRQDFMFCRFHNDAD